jgi:hypothetical protein
MATDNPSFICIGAQKAGTTWLYANLKGHPDAHLPPIKEIHYFDEIYRNEKSKLIDRITAKTGMNKWWWKGNIRRNFKGAVAKRSPTEFIWFTQYYFFKRNIEWYRKLLNCPSDKISGDITPDYCILGKNVVKFIKENLPNLLKIIYIIRNPVDRAWSALKMRYVKRRGYNLEDIDEKLVDDYYQKFHEFNDIHRTIDNWTTFFSNDQFKISFYDELVEKPLVFYNNILNYLGVKEMDDQENEMLKKRIYAGINAEMPLRIKKILCKKNFEQLVYLNDYFEKSNVNYPNKWLNDAKETLKLV